MQIGQELKFCKGQKCCPSFHIQKDQVILRDDDEPARGSFILTMNEFKDLIRTAQEWGKHIN